MRLEHVQVEGEGRSFKLTVGRETEAIFSSRTDIRFTITIIITSNIVMYAEKSQMDFK